MKQYLYIVYSKSTDRLRSLQELAIESIIFHPQQMDYVLIDGRLFHIIDVRIYRARY